MPLEAAAATACLIFSLIPSLPLHLSLPSSIELLLFALWLAVLVCPPHQTHIQAGRQAGRQKHIRASTRCRLCLCKHHITVVIHLYVRVCVCLIAHLAYITSKRENKQEEEIPRQGSLLHCCSSIPLSLSLSLPLMRMQYYSTTGSTYMRKYNNHNNNDDKM